jgi:hypothetical protein
MRLDFLLAGDFFERAARLRELRALALLLLGQPHPATCALAAAVADPALAASALEALTSLPALPKRRLLASFGVLMA